MTTWILCWLVFPVVVVALSLGLGLLAERLTRTQLPATVILAVGMSALVVVTSLLTAFHLTAVVAGPVLVVLAAIGWLLSRPTFLTRARRRWSSLSAVAVFACYAAPVALSGAVSWAGFIKLDDTATWLALADRLSSEGHTTDGLAQSTYGVLIDWLFGIGYPVGAFADLGVLARLVGQDPAWIVQPLMATLAAGLGWALYAATAGLIRSLAWRAVVSFLAATSTLLVGYALWGGLKEVTLALLLVTCCLLLAQGRSDPRPVPAQAALFAIPMAGVFVVFGIAGVVYLVPLGLAELALIWRFYGLRRLVGAAIVFVVVFALLGLSNILLLGRQLTEFTNSSLRGAEDIGNLFGPLRFAQIFGVWPTGDFRVEPSAMGVTWLLVVLVAAGMVGGVVIAVRRRRPTVPVFVVMSVVVALWSVPGNAWLEGKVLAVASPAMLLAAGVAFAYLAENGRRFEGVTLVGLIGVGVIVSNTMAYREVWNAPADRMAELADIGASTALKPALMLEYNPPAARHFLRNLDVEAAGELRYNVIPMNSGVGLDKGAFADIDDFPLSSINAYPTLVLRTELTGSRPPSTYVVARPGLFYDVWAPDPAAPAIIQHWPLGDHTDAAAIAPCSVVREAIAKAGPAGRVAVARRTALVTVPFDAGTLPAGWASGSQPGSVSVAATGSITVPFTVAAEGQYLATLGGSLWGGVKVTVDGRDWHSDQGRLNWTPYSNPTPSIDLTTGPHSMTVEYSGGWRPGMGYSPSEIGPVQLSLAGADVPVTYVPAAQALSLCGQRLDWVEAIGR